MFSLWEYKGTLEKNVYLAFEDEKSNKYIKLLYSIYFFKPSISLVSFSLVDFKEVIWFNSGKISNYYFVGTNVFLQVY